VLDAVTDAGRGIGFLIPFSNERFFFPWRPIETASVHPGQFFSARGLAVLWSEIRWVWLPLAGVAAVVWLGRRGSRIVKR
jgi:inner membrane protein